MRKTQNAILIKFAFLLTFCFETAALGALPLLEQPAVAEYFIRPGEVLEYSVKLKGIPAGTQILEVNGVEMLDGYKVYHMKSVSRVNRFFNMLYPFSNQYESFIQSKNFHPLRYIKRIRDGEYKGNFNVDFDQDSQIARVIKNGKQLNIRVPLGTQDELSMIYLFRSREIEVGQRYQFSLLTGTKIEKTTITVLRNERLKTVMGTLDTIVVKTVPKDIVIWLTDDALRIPVRIEVSTKAGRLVSKLKSVN